MTAPGLYPGISRSAYEAIPAINVSSLEGFERSAAHARERMLHPPEPTEAMSLGTAFHMSVLEPDRFAKEYACAPKCDRRTKVGKEMWAQFEADNEGKELLAEDDFTTVTHMSASAWAHPIAKQMLGGVGHNEVAVVWKDEETGLLAKGLIDRISPFDGWTFIQDVKSTLDASRRAFTRQVRNLNYAAKAAFYVDGCNTVAPRDRRFALIAVEKLPPYEVAIYEIGSEALAAGRSTYHRWLRLYELAKRTNIWPGYEVETQELDAHECVWNTE
jgi:hypothetical protein